MYNRRPRKVKKLAKKKKAKHDAAVMVQTAVVSVMGAIQFAHIQSLPILKDANVGAIRTDKALAATKAAIDTTLAVSKSLQQIKSWREHASK